MEATASADPTHKKRHYGRLLVMVVLHFIAMYALMYAMVDRFANVYPNYNQLYMAGLMTAPMVLIEISLMSAMFARRTWNLLILGLSVVAGLGFFWSIRRQTAIGDEQFLKSMIPHHAGAILMCGRASIRDPEIEDLCQSISTSQQTEIDQMKGILSRLER